MGNPSNGWYGYIAFSGSQSLTGNGTVVFGDSGNNYVYLVNGGTTLTLGPGIMVQGQNGNIGDGYGSVVNQGTISADVAGGTITINAQPFVNQATLIGTGGTFSVSGLWDNRSGIIVAGGTNQLELTGGGTIWGGMLSATNGASLVIGTCTFDGATVNGTLDVGNSVNRQT